MSELTHKVLKPNYYEILDISMGADEEEIRRAYDRIKQIYSEDSLAVYGLYSAEEIREVREQIEQAFRILIDQENRRSYDQSLISEPAKKKKQLQITIRARENDADEETVETGHEESGEQSASQEPVSTEPPPREALGAFKRGELKIPDDVVFTGEFLRELRELHKIDLRHISETTKVSYSNLRMIEDEEWSKLPAIVYVKGFIVQYAKYMGLDEQRVMTDLVARYESSKDYNAS